MANTNFDRMVKLGEWLEIFLDEDTKFWKYRELTEKFIEYYEVDLPLFQNEITLQVLEFIDGTGLQKRDKYTQSLREVISLPEMAMEGLFNKNKFDSFYNIQSKEAQEILSVIKNGIIYKDEDIKTGNIDDYFGWIIYAHKKSAYIFQTKPIVKETFLQLYKDIRPWDIALSEIYRKEQPWEEKDPFKLNKWILFLQGYNGLTEVIRIGAGRVKKQPTFSQDHFLSFPGACKIGERPSAFPWDVAVSRVFFDFLFLGGQDHFGFCEWCGNFFVSKRKGLKKYCSDKCRANHRNQINREKAATQQ